MAWPVRRVRAGFYPAVVLCLIALLLTAYAGAAYTKKDFNPDVNSYKKQKQPAFAVPYVPGELIVKFKSGVNIGEKTAKT